ncbi:HEPN domain-containing protein [Vibrio genomosp. F6]|uniref:HEPN domain-containing protein n=1 Tax=Vibrio genomosp. F6 TaxID=723172 RepID=UPI00148271D4|nr:HEPN domain-containing protein [Vibrio genomosp. F6]
MSEQDLRHGQALSLQWVTFALQKMVKDIETGGSTTNTLIGNCKSVAGDSGLGTLSTGSDYVLNFLIPFSVELALKALLIKEGIDPGHIHNLVKLYGKLSTKMQDEIQRIFKEEQQVTKFTMIELLERHKADFVMWRYLDKAEELHRDEVELQLALSAILDLYNSKA